PSIDCPFSHPCSPDLEPDQSGFHQRPMIDRFVAIFHPQMRGQLICGDNPSMRDLETWLPWQQFDFCPPYRANQHQILLLTTETRTSAEPEEPGVSHDGTRLFQ